MGAMTNVCFAKPASLTIRSTLALPVKWGTLNLPPLIASTFGSVDQTKCLTPAVLAARMAAVVCLISSVPFSQKLVTRNTPCAFSNAASRVSGRSKSASTTSSAMPPCLPGFRLSARTLNRPSVCRARTTAPPCCPVVPITEIRFLLLNSTVLTVLLAGDQHHSEASFVPHHSPVSLCSIHERNSFDHWTDFLQGAEGKRVLCIYRRSSHGPCNRTHTEKKRDRIDANRFVSARSGDNELTARSESSEKRRHGSTVCRCREEHPGTLKCLKCGNGILSVAVDVMMCPELSGETFLFWAAGDGCDLKTHASCKLNSEVTETTHSLNGDEFARPGL